MRFTLILVFASVFSMFQATTLLANDIKERRADAAEYYSERNFNKAYKIYFSLAKIGDHYSQNKISQMYVSGEGVETDLTEAYAWSVLAAESGVAGMTEKSDVLLQKTEDKAKADKRAKKFLNKYGKQTLAEKTASKEKYKANHAMGGCTGSKLGCS